MCQLYLNCHSLNFRFSPANLPVSAAKPLLQFHGRRCVLSARPSESELESPSAHPPNQRELLLRRGVQLLPAAAAATTSVISGAINTAANATAVSAADALQPQLPAAVGAHDATPFRSLRNGRYLLRGLHAATHSEHGQCGHLQLIGGLRLARPPPQPLHVDLHAVIGASGAQDAPAAQPVGCGQTVSSQRCRVPKDTLPGWCKSNQTVIYIQIDEHTE